MWAASVAGLAVRSAVASIRKSVFSHGLTRTISSQTAKSASVVTRICDQETTTRNQPQQRRSKTFKTTASAIQAPFARANIANDNHRFATLQPLSSLGGMSLVAYMAVEATEGHIQLWNHWKPDVAQDLVISIAKSDNLSRELFAATDRMEDLEIMVNDLTVFIEMQKEEISRLKQAH